VQGNKCADDTWVAAIVRSRRMRGRHDGDGRPADGAQCSRSVRFGTALVLACSARRLLPPPHKVPVVTLIAAKQWPTFCGSRDDTLTASASDPDGTVAKVEFYQGTTSHRHSTASPYTADHGTTFPQVLSLTAKAPTIVAGTKTSTAASITVTGAKFGDSCSGERCERLRRERCR